MSKVYSVIIYTNDGRLENGSFEYTAGIFNNEDLANTVCDMLNCELNKLAEDKYDYDNRTYYVVNEYMAVNCYVTQNEVFDSVEDYFKRHPLDNFFKQEKTFDEDWDI